MSRLDTSSFSDLDIAIVRFQGGVTLIERFSVNNERALHGASTHMELVEGESVEVPILAAKALAKLERATFLGDESVLSPRIRE